MAKFGEVFSTTWKVLLALFVISVGIGLISLVIGVMGRAGGGSSSSDEWTRTYEVKNADEAYAKMPKSQWDGEIKRCIEEHTVIEGMTKDQVKQAVGGSLRSYSMVTLKGSDQKCIKYEGEQCVEYPPDEVKSFTLHFTPKGNLIWDEDSIGLSVYGKHYLADLPVAQPVPVKESEGATIASPEKSPATAEVGTPQRIRVSSGVSTGLLIYKTTPNYPPLALQARIQGAVVLLAEISKEGTIQSLQVISGHPMLVPAAIEAVKEWRYNPYLLNGEPVAVETEVLLNFSLSGG
jgi:TonB family protein